jgi:hypothetical protein
MEDKKNHKTNMDKKQFHSCSIWPIVSYINYYYYSNTRHDFISDIIIVRTAQDLLPNTEITLWYHMPVANSYNEYQKSFGSRALNATVVYARTICDRGSMDHINP